MTWTDTLTQCAWRGTLILVVAFAASAVLRRRASAAWRHFLWMAAVGALIALPAVVRVTPKWGVLAAPVQLSQESVSVQQSDAVTVTATPAKSSPVPASMPMPILIWMAGCAAAAVWFLTGRVRIWRMVWQARDATGARAAMDELGGRSIRLLESRSAPTALTAGTISPVIVLPMEWRDWPADRLRAVLLHEWIHVQRRDLLAQALAQAACCLYWFHPLAWMAARQIRKERERACDDAVLLGGIAAHDYAGHLVALVRALGSRRLGAVAMAEPSDLESRVRALLDTKRNRKPLNGRAALTIAAGCVAVLIPASAITAYARPYGWFAERPAPVAAAAPAPIAETTTAAAPEPAAVPVSVPTPAPAARRTERTDDKPAAAAAAVETPQATGSLSGIVTDPSGARVPNAHITARGTDGSAPQTAVSDAAGSYVFQALVAGTCNIEVSVPGFRAMRVQLNVEGGKVMVINPHLTLGELNETVSVKATRPASAAPAVAASDSGRIKIGGNVQAAMILKRTQPNYPAELKAQGVTGVVHIEAIIKKDGTLTDLHVMNSNVDPALITAATDAVSQWQYRPTLLNGEPVAVVTYIDVSFDLSQGQ
jgi:TonB family protein